MQQNQRNTTNNMYYVIEKNPATAEYTYNKDSLDEPFANIDEVMAFTSAVAEGGNHWIAFPSSEF